MLNESLPEFKRLIPEGGLCVYPGVWYYDVADIDKEIRTKVRGEFKHDPEYIVSENFTWLIDKGKKNRTFVSYVYKDQELVGIIRFDEYLKNPDGYGYGEFVFSKLIVPKYRRTKYSRYAFSDLMHWLFMADVAKNLYTYAPLLKEYNENDFFMNIIDKQLLPCFGVQFAKDGKDVQKYIIVKKIIKTRIKDFALLEFNGDIYRNMDLLKYFSTSTDIETAKKWLDDMNEGAERIKCTVSM